MPIFLYLQRHFKFSLFREEFRYIVYIPDYLQGGQSKKSEPVNPCVFFYDFSVRTQRI